MAQRRAADAARGGGALAGTDFGYRGLCHGLRSAVRAEGAASLYRGLLPRLVLKSCGGSIWYTTYMACRSALSHGR